MEMIKIIVSIAAVTIANLTFYQIGRHHGAMGALKKIEEYYEEFKEDNKEW